MENNKEVVGQILNILAPLIPDGTKIEATTNLTTDLGLDSLKVMKMLERLEDVFDISIPINILPKIRTVEDLGIEIERILRTGG